MNIVQRIKAPTPKFFRVLRAGGLSLAASGLSIISAPSLVPPPVLAIASYAILGGSLVAAVSQLAVETNLPDDEPASKQ